MMIVEVKDFDILNKWFEVAYENSLQENGSSMQFLIRIAGYFEQYYTFDKRTDGIASVIEHQFGGDKSHS